VAVMPGATTTTGTVTAVTPGVDAVDAAHASRD
jgi:hypothetical protein